MQGKTNFIMSDKSTAVFVNQRLLRFSVYRVSKSVMNKLWILSVLWRWEQLSIQYPQRAIDFRTPHNDFSGWIQASFEEDCSTRPEHQTKAWLKLWYFQCVVLSVCMQLNTHNWDLPSRSLRPICRNVCLCVCVPVCVCLSLYNNWAKRDFDKTTNWLD